MTTSTITPAAVYPARPARPFRHDIHSALDAILSSAGRGAWQGAPGSHLLWRGRTDAADLDLWVSKDTLPLVDEALGALAGAVIQGGVNPKRLTHKSYAVETYDGVAVVDVTFGDLKVGPVLLVPESEVTTAFGTFGWGLTGVAGAADNFLRPLLRGKLAPGERLEKARQCWDEAPKSAHDAFRARLSRQLGKGLTSRIVAALEGAELSPSLLSSTRRALMLATLKPAALGSTWRARKTIIPARKPAPLGVSHSGVLVVLAGTDGSGKSTVAGELANRLSKMGISTEDVYMGMARGNLPGVSLARRLLRVPETSTAPVVSKPAAPDSSLMRAARRAGAWFYAGEYYWRYLTKIRPSLKAGKVVICDRYAYDLRQSPFPGSKAYLLAETLLPVPDVFLLPDAPDRIIHARKPERTAEEQAQQQDQYRKLGAELASKLTFLKVDTSGLDPEKDHVAPAVTASLVAAHRRHVLV